MLKAELLEFKRKINANAHQSYSALEGKHDDLIMSLALAIHYVRRIGIPNLLLADGTVSERDRDNIGLP